MKIFEFFSARMSESERQIVTRFNKISLDHTQTLRAEIGEIIAANAASGTLNSGFTVKRAYDALQSHLNQMVDESLQLVSNKTLHDGRQRKKLLDHLRGQVRHHHKHMNRQIEEVVVKRMKLGGDATASAEWLARSCLEKGLDRVEKYADGLTAPKDERWHLRNPLAVIAVGAAITGLIGLAIAMASRWLN